jgi:hypothetical protein
MENPFGQPDGNESVVLAHAMGLPFSKALRVAFGIGDNPNLPTTVLLKTLP